MDVAKTYQHSKCFAMGDISACHGYSICWAVMDANDRRSSSGMSRPDEH
jgi:hypothetical protein